MAKINSLLAEFGIIFAATYLCYWFMFRRVVKPGNRRFVVLLVFGAALVEALGALVWSWLSGIK